MSEKRTKSDKERRQADQLEKKAARRPAQNQDKEPPGEDVNQGAAEQSPPTASDAKSHIVDRTHEYLGRAFIITGAPKPKK